MYDENRKSILSTRDSTLQVQDRRSLVLTSTLVLFSSLLFSSCGGGSSTPPTYSIGGSISGLTAGGLTLANGSDTLSITPGSGSFQFPTSVGNLTIFNVTVSAQPSGLNCLVGYGYGKVQAADVSTVQVNCFTDWTWIGGSSAPNSIGVYGIQGTASVVNMPGSRYGSMSWVDTAGQLWLFGGVGSDGAGGYGSLNDLWRYSPLTGQWAWVSGSISASASGVYGSQGVPSAVNSPGARIGTVSWTDLGGNFWLFGGSGYDSVGNLGNLNDLWMYSTTSGQWTWVSGSNLVDSQGNYGSMGVAATTNVPPAREEAAAWTDHAGRFWLFGGAGPAGGSYLVFLNDLWMYGPTTHQWTWISGSTGPRAAGVYGTQGTASATNTPGARIGGAQWTDSSGNLWLMGGYGYDYSGVTASWINDLWMFDTDTTQWTWVSGLDSIGGVATVDAPGVAATSNVPGALFQTANWSDSSGNFWMFGGFGNFNLEDQNYENGLWEYKPSTSEWTYATAYGISAVSYGSLGVPSSTNIPSARTGAATWVDANGKHWMFGGTGEDSNNEPANFGDLWNF